MLMAAKFGIPVCPHAGGVGLCEHVQHLAMFDYICVGAGKQESQIVEYVDHLHEHFIDPCVMKDGCYTAPTLPVRQLRRRVWTRRGVSRIAQLHAPPRPDTHIHTVFSALIRAHAYRMLICACGPMPCPNHVVTLTHSLSLSCARSLPLVLSHSLTLTHSLTHSSGLLNSDEGRVDHRLHL